MQQRLPTSPEFGAAPGSRATWSSPFHGNEIVLYKNNPRRRFSAFRDVFLVAIRTSSR